MVTSIKSSALNPVESVTVKMAFAFARLGIQARELITSDF